MYDDDEEQEEGPKSSFTTYLAEGDVLFKQGEFKKALDSYNLALELKPTEKFALVARSRCHLQLGDTESALKDAETALEDDKEFIRALYQKAEALYCMGDFEHALVFYHRGNKLRPEQQEFRLGIQKAQEAIDNSIGRVAKIKLENKGDLSFFAKQDEVKKPKGYTKPKAGLKRNQQQQQANRGKNVKPAETSSKTVKQLLGALYQDREYLEGLRNDKDFVRSGKSDSVISTYIDDGIRFLDQRTEFWRQQKPLYARKTSKPTNKPKPKPKTENQADFIVRSLEEIDQKLADGDEEGSLKQAENTLRTVKTLNDKEIPNKQDVIANLHSCIGNAHLEMDNATKALESHKRDLNISKKIESKDGISRAFDNIGRCQARLGHYGEAIDSWMEKLPLSKSPLETTWLHHEIGRCYLELKNFQDALECGQRSLKSAQQAKEQIWELNATVLIAQAQVKIGNLRDALDSFQSAYDLANLLEDTAATAAVAKAIDDVNERITKDGNEAKSGNDETEGQPEDDEKKSDHDSVDGGDYRRAEEQQDNEDNENAPGKPSVDRENDDVEPDTGDDPSVNQDFEDHAAPATPEPAKTTKEGPVENTSDNPAETASEGPAGTTSEDPAKATSEGPAATTTSEGPEDKEPQVTMTKDSAGNTSEDPTGEGPAGTTSENTEDSANKDLAATTNKDPGD